MVYYYFAQTPATGYGAGGGEARARAQQKKSGGGGGVAQLQKGPRAPYSGFPGGGGGGLNLGPGLPTGTHE